MWLWLICGLVNQDQSVAAAEAQQSNTHGRGTLLSRWPTLWHTEAGWGFWMRGSVLCSSVCCFLNLNGIAFHFSKYRTHTECLSMFYWLQSSIHVNDRDSILLTDYMINIISYTWHDNLKQKGNPWRGPSILLNKWMNLFSVTAPPVFNESIWTNVKRFELPLMISYTMAVLQSAALLT